MFVFVNKTGTDKRSALCKFGYFSKGQSALSEKLLIRRKAIFSYCSNMHGGIVDVKITTKTVNSQAFC